MVASITVAKGPLKLEFRTCNQMTRPHRITMALKEGPFRDLTGAWDFTPLGAGGSKVRLSLGFEFESRAADLLLGPPFEALCNSLVDAFVQRATAAQS